MIKSLLTLGCSTFCQCIGYMRYSSDLTAKILKVTVIKGREGGRCDALRPSHHQFWGGWDWQSAHSIAHVCLVPTLFPTSSLQDFLSQQIGIYIVNTLIQTLPHNQFHPSKRTGACEKEPPMSHHKNTLICQQNDKKTIEGVSTGHIKNHLQQMSSQFRRYPLYNSCLQQLILTIGRIPTECGNSTD